MYVFYHPLYFVCMYCHLLFAPLHGEVLGLLAVVAEVQAALKRTHLFTTYTIDKRGGARGRRGDQPHNALYVQERIHGKGTTTAVVPVISTRRGSFVGITPPPRLRPPMPERLVFRSRPKLVTQGDIKLMQHATTVGNEPQLRCVCWLCALPLNVAQPSALMYLLRHSSPKNCSSNTCRTPAGRID